MAAVILVSLPSDSNVFFGLSPARLMILSAILLLAILCTLFIFHPIRDRLISILTGKHSCFIILTTLAMAAICLVSLAILYDLYIGTHVYFYFAYAQRLAPFLTYVAVILIQVSSLLIVKNRKNWLPLLKSEKPFLLTWMLVYGGILVLVSIIVTSGLGLIADEKGWGDPTVPLMEWQIWLGIFICLGTRVFAETRLFTRLVRWKQDNPISSSLVISTLIWFLAVSIWSSQPVPPGFFATPPRAPNFEIYPFSDAAFYDHYSQSLLIGLGFRGDSIPPRPLYIVALAIFHLIGGQDYSSVIFIQTLLLAIFPVVVFWIGRKLGSDVIGWICALYVILRELTSILSTPFTSDVSNTKLLFADIPAALVISLVILFTTTWLQNPRRPVYGLITGGILGISLLVRTQIIILLPVILVVVWLELFRQRSPFKSLFLPTVLFLAGLVLAIAPWLSRNYGITGQLVFDHPESQTRIMVQRYFPEIEPEDFDRRPGETTIAYNSRLSTALRERIISDPLYVARFVSAHWLNNQIANLQIFPVRFSIVNIMELVFPQHPFWEEWDGTTRPRETALLLVNLAMLSLGAVYLVRKAGWAGVFPLLVNLAYHFSNAAARNSGWRYLLPVDWIYLVYFSAGIFALINLGITQVKQQTVQEMKNKTPRVATPIFSLVSIAAGILCVGFTPLLAEKAFPRVYETATAGKLRNVILENAKGMSSNEKDSLESALDSPDTKILYGRMLYPRFYDAGEGEKKTGKTGYAPSPYARYVFLVAGDPEGTIIFPHTQSDLPLKNAQDVILVGCMDGLAVKAGLVILPEQNYDSYTAEQGFSQVCPGRP